MHIHKHTYAGTRFAWKQDQNTLHVTCPWGNSFELRGDAKFSKDNRGTQPGAPSEPLGMPELRVNVPYDGDLGAVARFYKDVIGVSLYVNIYIYIYIYNMCVCMYMYNIYTHIC